ncbi:hypothetical protein BDY21DRAFT_304126 [Lineolata rhizophorae]|uniref:Sugar phosphate phosphatase n=1 Tax=Lineolata rhizophorae TaxID=578093 RepID=A0A6A6P009_9PEZI|nr:hypothetical protein BDY21DRAFT_304126 [Lineolata rhizophorae]
MEFEPKVPPSSTADRTSFAYISARDRWPVILTGVIDDVHRASLKSTDPDMTAEGKKIVSEVAALKYELQHDRQIAPIPDDGEADVAMYNEELKARGSPKWFDVSWLYSECYLYRRLSTIFNLSTNWKSHDPFFRQKLSTFKQSRSAVLELAARYQSLIQTLSSPDDTSTLSADKKRDADAVLFAEMCDICLWGNATDLSLLTNLSYADIQALQGAAARKAAEANIVANDLPAAFEALLAAKRARDAAGDSSDSATASGRVDIVLDNAGFELYVDLVLAGYLIAAGLADTVVLHPKSVPWFVSDVVPADFAALLGALAEPRGFFEAKDEDDHSEQGQRAPPPLADEEVKALEGVFEHWRMLHGQGKLVIRPNRFWTLPGSFWRMREGGDRLGWGREVRKELQSSDLVIFKGDLNYRKLTADVLWDPTTPFADAIGPLGPGSGIRTLALRTCKADVVVGLPPGKDEELRAMEGGGGNSGARKWAWSGKWAVVQFCDGEKSS